MDQPIDVVIFDGDDTLWHHLAESQNINIALSDDGPGPGSPDFTFEVVGEGLIRRNDGQRFQLFPEVPELLQQLQAAGKHISLASYNYPEPVFRALAAFGIYDFFEHPVAAWTPRKEVMIELILSCLEQKNKGRGGDNPLIARDRVLFVDDSNSYALSAEKVGVHFWHLQSHHDLLRILTY